MRQLDVRCGLGFGRQMASARFCRIELRHNEIRGIEAPLSRRTEHAGNSVCVGGETLVVGPERLIVARSIERDESRALVLLFVGPSIGNETAGVP